MTEGSLFKVGDNIRLDVMLLLFALLAVVLFLLEKALHYLEHHTRQHPKYHEIINKTYRGELKQQRQQQKKKQNGEWLLTHCVAELMLVGLIALCLKLVRESNLVQGKSAQQAMLAFEAADTAIFLMALALIFQATTICLRLRGSNRQAAKTELMASHDLFLVMQREDQDRVFRPMQMNPVQLFCHELTLPTGKVQEMAILRVLRHSFLRTHGLPELFPYAKYLRQSQDSQVSHLIDVEASTWLLVFGISWTFYCVDRWITHSHFVPRDTEDHEKTKRRTLEAAVVAYLTFTWFLILLHALTLAYFNWCIRFLLVKNRCGNRVELVMRLRQIAEEESYLLSHEVPAEAISQMERIQEEQQTQQYEKRRGFMRNDSGFELLWQFFHYCHQRLIANTNKEKEAHIPVNPSEAAKRAIQIPYFNPKAWHYWMKVLVISNAFFFSICVETVVYQMAEVAAELSVLTSIAVPIPLIVNTVIFQVLLLRKYLLISSICRVDAKTLSDVIGHFTEIVSLRYEFVSSIQSCLQESGKTVNDLVEQLEIADLYKTGLIDVEEMRKILKSFVGFDISFYRFNSVVKLLFDLKGTHIKYERVKRLLLMMEKPMGFASMHSGGELVVSMDNNQESPSPQLIPLTSSLRMNQYPRRSYFKDPLDTDARASRGLFQLDSLDLATAIDEPSSQVNYVCM